MPRRSVTSRTSSLFPRTRSRNPTRQLSRLFDERRNLQTLSDQWDEEVLSTHRTRADGGLQQQQRRTEKLFGQLLQHALKLNGLRVQDVGVRNPEAVQSFLPQLGTFLEQNLRSALAPTPKTRVSAGETERSTQTQARFRTSSQDVQTALQTGSARALRNR